jgi:hypothetical protein
MSQSFLPMRTGKLSQNAAGIFKLMREFHSA